MIMLIPMLVSKMVRIVIPLTMIGNIKQVSFPSKGIASKASTLCRRESFVFVVKEALRISHELVHFLKVWCLTLGLLQERVLDVLIRCVMSVATWYN